MFDALKQKLIFRRPEDAQLVQQLLREQGLPHWQGYALAFAFSGIASACTGLTTYLLGSVINRTYVDRNFTAVVAISLALLALCTVRGLATYANAIVLARVGNRIIADTQRRLFDKLLREGIGYFSDRRSTELLTSMSSGAASIANILSLIVLTLGRDLMSVIALLAVMVWHDPVLSLIGLIVLPIVMLGVQKLMRRARTIATTQFSGAVAIQGTVQETIQGLRIVKAFNLEDRLRSRISADIQSVEKASNKLSRIANRSEPLIEALGGSIIAIACIYAGYRVLQTGTPPGALVAFMTAFMLVFQPVRRIARVNVELVGNLTAARALLAQLNSPPAEPDDSHLPGLACRQGLVEIDDVTFAYREGSPVLRSLSLVAQPGKVTALVGQSGGGKSTIFNLLLRLYDADSGRISIDGQSVRGINRKSLREAIAYVGQDVFLFRGSVRDNILVGKPDASEQELVDATKAAYAHDFIMAFPQGYDTPVGELGMQLSLGQRQRVAVARALIKNAPIILLDEPTASLDSESEHHVQQALRRLCAGKTTLVIAHRLVTVRDADRIHVIENGSIIESGRHLELLERQGRYATFYHLQFLDEDGSGPERAAETTRLPL